MNRPRWSLITLCLIALTGCSFLGVSVTPGDKDDSNSESGIWKSNSKGSGWEHMPITKKQVGVHVIDMLFDPQDPLTIYLLTADHGLFVSYNGGNAWQNILTRTGAITALAVDPQIRHIVYASQNNIVFRSIDGGNIWNESLLETQGVSVTALAVSYTNSKFVYAGTATGQIFTSFDKGVTWRRAANTETHIQKFLIHPDQPQLLFAKTKTRGILRSTGDGATWEALNMDAFPGALVNGKLILDPNIPGGLIYASDHGILVSTDSGGTWSSLRLLTEPNTTTIHAIAINPLHPYELYYASRFTFYRSFDRGETWNTTPLPTDNVPTTLLVDPVDQNILYLGSRRPPEENKGLFGF